MTKDEYISKFKSFYTKNKKVKFADIISKNNNIKDIDDKILNSATGYNVTINNNITDDKIHILYNMQIEEPGHIERLLEKIFENIESPIQYDVFLKGSTVKVEDEWGRFEELDYEKRNDETLWRSVEIVLDFKIDNKADAEKLYDIFQKYCYAGKKDAIQKSWVIPDIRIKGQDKIGNTEEIGIKRIKIGKNEIIVLVDAEESNEKIYVNPELKNYILGIKKEKKQMKKLFIVPNNDAEAVRIQKLISENNNGDYEMLITGQDWRGIL